MACPILTSTTSEVVTKTLPLVADLGPKFTSHFYNRLFKANPTLLNVFNISNQEKGFQQKSLFNFIANSSVCFLGNEHLPDSLTSTVTHKHCALNVQPEHYSIVGEHILGTIEDLLTKDKGVLDSWGEVYGNIADTLIEREEALYKETDEKEGGWRGLRDFIVSKKELVSNSNMGVSFKPVDGKQICDYTDGQYTTIWAHGKNWEYTQPRHYTLTIPHNLESYNITVSKNGLVSTYVHDELKEGDIVKLSAPYGNYNLKGAANIWTEGTEVPVVFISGGIGMTPVISMLYSIKNLDRNVVWLHSSYSGGKHPYLKNLVKFAKEKENFTRRVWYTEPTDNDVQGAPDDNFAQFHYKGFIDLTKVKDLITSHPNTQFYVCGPEKFMSHCFQQLDSLNIPKDNVHYELFGTGTVDK